MTSPTLKKAVSTWSLHRTLGNFVADDSAVNGGRFMTLPALDHGISLLDLIPELDSRGYTQLQICHFHLESQAAAHLEELRSRMETHGIELDMLLIDDGDLTAEDIQHQLDWYDSWLNTAEALGAKRARLCAGRSAPNPEKLRASGLHLADLARRHPNVRIVTENWMEMMPDAESVLQVLDTAGESVGLLIDLANWHKPEKYEQLPSIADRAEACHAKCVFTSEGPDEDDFRRTLGMLRDAGFSGPLALIYDGPDDDEWAGLEIEWEIAKSVLG